jgi:hypothetical protein
LTFFSFSTFFSLSDSSSYSSKKLGINSTDLFVSKVKVTYDDDDDSDSDSDEEKMMMMMMMMRGK